MKGGGLAAERLEGSVAVVLARRKVVEVTGDGDAGGSGCKVKGDEKLRSAGLVGCGEGGEGDDMPGSGSAVW